MQYKLLQFYKVLSNFSTNLIGGFVPLIVYDSTQNLYLAIASMVAGYLATILANCVLRKVIYKLPELCLCLRILPIICMQIVLLFIPTYPIIMMLVFAVFYGLSGALTTLPCEIIYSYATPQEGTSATSLGITRVFEQLGYVLSAVTGGLFLDSIPTVYVVIISLTLYFVASLPLMIYYIKNRKNTLFNAETVSNAHIYYESKVESQTGDKVCKKISTSYFIYYLFAVGADAFYTFFTFATFLATGSFLISGVLTASCDVIYGVMMWITTKLDEKYDLTVLSSVALFIIAACITTAAFTIGMWPSYVCFLAMAIVWPIPALFVNQRMLAKTQILGISNDCNFLKTNSMLTGQTLCVVAGFSGSVLAIFAVGAVFVAFVGGILPTLEEKTRKTLVDYIENN